MKLSYNNQLILFGVLFLVLAGAIVGLLIVPQIQAIADVDSRIAEADVQIQLAQDLLVQRQGIKARSAQTEAERMRLSNQMPETPELPSFIIELQDTVNDAGLELHSITPTTPSLQEAGYSSIDISVYVKGTWSDTVDFLQRITRLTRQVRVVSISTTRPDPDDDTPADAPNEVDTFVTIRVYTMPFTVAPVVVPPAPDDAAETQ